MTNRMILADLFQKSQSDLDGSVKSKVLDFVVKLQRDPKSPGLRLKTPQGVADSRVKVGRVNDFWRAVVIELPKAAGYVLAAVKPHDKAYDYAARLRLGVNDVTGALEVIDNVATMEALERAEAKAPGPGEVSPVLHGVRAQQLVSLGVPADLAERLARLTDQDALFDLADTLPRAQSDAVLDLAAGRSPEEVWADLIQQDVETPIDTSDVEAALERSVSRLSFVPMENMEEFQAAFEGSFERWRVWLHPLQRRLAQHNGWNGPYRVTGGAGTGKTVTAIHRAHHLASRLDAAGAPASERILVTTFTRNLAQAIRAMLVKVGGKNVLDRVEVLHLDALANRVLRSAAPAAGRLDIVEDASERVHAFWEIACTGTVGASFDVEFLQAEWRDVVLAQGITSRDEYLHASRAGRRRRLSRPQRAVVWQSINRFLQLMDANDILTFTQVLDRAARVATPTFAHGVVDEAQDFHPAHWRLMRSVVQPGTDDLFIAGDSHQRIYGRPVVLSRCGIETRGRSRRLTVNYRTSRQILRWCLGVAARNADDLEGMDETLAGARSAFDGPEPEQRGFRTLGEETAAVADRVAAWITDGMDPADIAVMSRAHHSLDAFEAALKSADIPTVRVEGSRDDDRLGAGARLMTMHRAKGLEFRAVALVGVDAASIPAPYVSQLGEEDREIETAKEQNLLYVAGSRAREALWVSWSSSPSKLLAPSE